MPLFLGIDTSNYTTSLALYDSACGAFRAAGRLLPVKGGLSASDKAMRFLPTSSNWAKFGKILAK